MYILCSFETVQHFEGIVSEFFSKIQTNLVMIYIFLYQDYLVPKPKTNFSLKSQRDALAWACNFVALLKQLSCERHLIFFMPQGNFSHFYALYCVFFQVLLQTDFFSFNTLYSVSVGMQGRDACKNISMPTFWRVSTSYLRILI